MSKLNLRVRGQNGKSGVIRGVDACESLEKLISHSIDCLGLDNATTEIVKILTGYPPKPLDLSDRDRSIEQLGIISGDNLLLETRTALPSSDPTKESNFAFGPPNTLNRSDSSKENSAPGDSSKENSTPPQDNSDSAAKRLKSSNADSVPDGKLARRVIPADNSCLFTAVNFCMSGEVVDSKHSYFMREVISSAVSSDQEKYNEAILGRENSNYCDWIKKTDTWGGAIEVQILAEYFQVEIVVADTKSGSLTRFGEGYNFDNRMALIYDGIHYDALYQKFNSDKDRTIFPSSQIRLMEEIKMFAEEAKSAHKFTDVAGFTLKSSMIRSMENHQHAGGDLNDDLEKAIAISLGNIPLCEEGFKPSNQTNDIKKSSKYKSNLYKGIEDISEDEQIKRLLELSKEESEKVQTLADQISEEEQMKKILEISRRESEESPTNDINTVGDEYDLYNEKPYEYSETCKTLEERRGSISDDPAIIELKKSPKAHLIKASDISGPSNDNSIYMSDDESDALEEATSNDSSGYKSLDNISLLGATAISPSKDSPVSTNPLSSSSGSSGISEFMDDAAFNLWMSLSAEQRRENMVSTPQGHPSSPVGPRPPQARPSSPVGPLSSFPTCSLESTAAHNRLATLTELQGDGSIVPPGMSEEDAFQRAIEESKKQMSVEQARGRGDWTARNIVPKGLSEDELIKRALEESKKEALWTSISNSRVDLNYTAPLVQDSRKDSYLSSKPQTDLTWPTRANTGTRPKKRVATPSLQPPAPVQRSSTPPSRPSWEETGARRKQRNGISKSPEPQGRRSNSNPGGSGYTVEGMTSGSGYTVEGMSEEEQLALALSQSRLEAPSSAVGVMGELRDVVVDGSNVGMHHGNHRAFSVKGISICVDYFTKLGHKVLVMMPRHRWNRASQQEKEVLDALEGSKVLFYTPARKTPTNSWTCYDDRFMVEYASQHGAVVLTNDNYRDLKDEPKYKDTIENRILPYMWANDTLMIPDDPMGRDGPKLEKFLRK